MPLWKMKHDKVPSVVAQCAQKTWKMIFQGTKCDGEATRMSSQYRRKNLSAQVTLHYRKFPF